MDKKQPDFTADELTLIKLAQDYSDPEKARTFFESLRWPRGPVCPHCKCDGKSKGIYKIEPNPGSKTRPGLYACGACLKQFTATVGTILEDSHLPISKWLMALFIMCSSKKSVSAHQLHRMLGITYKTAWFMAHRIRHAMGPGATPAEMLGGTVEVDETFIGGSREHLPKYAHEFEFRWNHRDVTDGQRTVALVAATQGKRLMYRQMV